MTNQNLNYFSEKEQKTVKRFTDFRTKLVRPLLEFFDLLKITPNMLSAAGFLSIFGFAYFANKNIYLAVLFILIHVIFDGLDGSLARYKNMTSNSGALVDIFVDQSAIVIGVLAAIYYSMINSFWGSLYIVFYVLMIVLLIILNHKNAPIKFIIRTKYFFFLVLLIDAYFKIETINYFLMIVGIYMVIATIYMFFKLEKVLRKS